MSSRDRNPSGRIITGFTKRGAPARDSSAQGRDERELEREAERLQGESDSGPIADADLEALTHFVPQDEPLPAISREEGLTLRPEQVEDQRVKLSVMPLAVLLPPLGDLKRLASSRGRLTKRFQDLASRDVPEEAQKERVAEELMLNQVLKWLSLGGRERE